MPRVWYSYVFKRIKVVMISFGELSKTPKTTNEMKFSPSDHILISRLLINAFPAFGKGIFCFL